MKPSTRWWRAFAPRNWRSFSLVRRRAQMPAMISSPTLSCPMKLTRPFSSSARVSGLPMSCSSAASRSAWPRVSSSASGSSSTAATRGPSSPNTDSGALEHSEHLLEHLDRVAVDVEVVEVALLDAVEPAELGENRGEHAERVGEAEPVEHAVGHHDPAQLGEDALAARPRPHPRPRRA